MERSRALLTLNILSLYCSSGSLFRASFTSASSYIVSSRSKPWTKTWNVKWKISATRVHIHFKCFFPTLTLSGKKNWDGLHSKVSYSEHVIHWSYQVCWSHTCWNTICGTQAGACLSLLWIWQVTNKQRQSVGTNCRNSYTDTVHIYKIPPAFHYSQIIE